MKHPLLEKALDAQQQNKLTESEQYFKSYLVEVPDDAQARYLLGMVCNQQNNYQHSIENLLKAIELNSESAQYFLGLGLSYDQNDQTELAEQAYRKAELMRPDVFQVHYDVGCFMQKQHRFEEAARYFRKTIELNAEHYPAYSNLSSALQNLGELKQAETVSRKINILLPNNKQIMNNLSQLLIGQQHYQEAMRLLEKAASIDADYLPVQFSYAWLNYLVNNKNKAQELFEKILSQEPTNFKVMAMLAKCLIDKQHYDSAQKLLEKSLKISPKYLGSILSLAELVAAKGDAERAILIYLNAIKTQPNIAELYYGLGIVYSQQGVFDKSRQYFSEALQVNSTYTPALHAITKTTDYQNLDNDEVKIAISLNNEINSNTSNLTPTQKQDLYFSLGKIYDDLKLYDEAFNYYQLANQLRYKNHPYDIEEFSKFNQQSENTFKDCSLKLKPQARSINPIFIVGMPRSGTTLLEQILSGHDEIFAAGELIEIQQITKTIENYPDFKTISLDKNLADLRSQYMDKIESVNNKDSSHWVVDKNPINFRHIGLIKMLLPDAKIIHMQRHPLDTILSIYFQRFSEAHKYAFNLKALSQYYIRYQELMLFWAQQFPASIIPCRYDKLVSIPEQTVSNILNLMGLDWQQGCEDFHKQKRQVATASSWQVRQPINFSGLERWKGYRSYLTSIEAILSDSINLWNKGEE